MGCFPSIGRPLRRWWCLSCVSHHPRMQVPSNGSGRPQDIGPCGVVSQLSQRVRGVEQSRSVYQQAVKDCGHLDVEGGHRLSGDRGSRSTARAHAVVFDELACRFTSAAAAL